MIMLIWETFQKKVKKIFGFLSFLKKINIFDFYD